MLFLRGKLEYCSLSLIYVYLRDSLRPKLCLEVCRVRLQYGREDAAAPKVAMRRWQVGLEALVVQLVLQISEKNP